jgi:hypothetical protein
MKWSLDEIGTSGQPANVRRLAIKQILQNGYHAEDSYHGKFSV